MIGTILSLFAPDRYPIGTPPPTLSPAPTNAMTCRRIPATKAAVAVLGLVLAAASSAAAFQLPRTAPSALRVAPRALAPSASSTASSTALGMAGGLRLPGMSRPVLSEDDLAAAPEASVVAAVEAMGSTTAVVAADVAARAGVPLSTARSSLSAMAALSGGDLAVSPDGELVYSFPANVRSVLSANSARYRAIQLWTKAWPRIFFGIRVGFGAALFVSIFAVFSTIFLVMAGGGSSSDDRDDRRRGGGGFGGGNLMLDLFLPRYNPFTGGFYSPLSYGYYGRTPYSVRYAGGTPRSRVEKDEPNVFERVFAYIFGDGDPNTGIQMARLRAASQVIRDSGGAVTAEQLAPFCDAPPMPDASYGGGAGSAYVDESYVLPLVSQLGGEPVVTDDGDLVYVFEDLQLSAVGALEAAGLEADLPTSDLVAYLREERGVSIPRGAVERSDLLSLLDLSLKGPAGFDPTAPLQEEEIKFNRSGTGWNALAGALGAVNLGGALYLGQILASPAMVGVRLPAYYGLVQSGYPLLLAYAVLYNAIPLARTFLARGENDKIRERNEARKKWSTVLRSAGAKVRRKLNAASKMRTGIKKIGKGDSVYDTTQDSKQLEEQRERKAMEDFDKMLRDDSSFQ